MANCYINTTNITTIQSTSDSFILRLKRLNHKRCGNNNMQANEIL